MKKIILTLIVALISLAAIAQKTEAKIRQTVTTKIDTILIDIPSGAKTMNDSVVLTKIDEIQKLVVQKTDDLSSTIKVLRREVKTAATNSGRAGNFVVLALKNIIPIVPFIAAVFAIFFWLRYVYRRKLLRQDLIVRYIDRGEAVPDWLTKSEYQPPFGINTAGEQEDNSRKLSSANAKVFLVFSIILAASTFIWAIALVNTNHWKDSIIVLFLAIAFGYATVWCFQQYLKRTE